MSTVRIAFDVNAAFVVACADLPCGNRRYKRGDAFPWREHALSEQDLATLWMALKVDVVPAGAFVALLKPAERIAFDPPRRAARR